MSQESLIAEIANSGVETADTPLIRVAVETARQIAGVFEAAIAHGEIKLDQFFDENYREIRGTDPKQYLTNYVALTDRLLPPIQDPVQKRSADRLFRRLGQGRLPSDP